MAFAIRALVPGLLPLFLAASSCTGNEADSAGHGGERQHGGAGGSEPEPVTLFPLRQLTPVPLAEDAWAEHRPVQVDCSEVGGWYREAEGIEIDTGSCNYFSMRETAVAAANAGDVLSFTVSHYDLTAPEPAEAHVALFVDGESIFERRFEIPRAGQVVEVREPLQRDVSARAELVIHLHNHGQNTWRITPLVAAAPE